jgi:hypothetical protein
MIEPPGVAALGAKVYDVNNTVAWYVDSVPFAIDADIASVLTHEP